MSVDLVHSGTGPLSPMAVERYPFGWIEPFSTHCGLLTMKPLRAGKNDLHGPRNKKAVGFSGLPTACLIVLIFRASSACRAEPRDGSSNAHSCREKTKHRFEPLDTPNHLTDTKSLFPCQAFSEKTAVLARGVHNHDPLLGAHPYALISPDVCVGLKILSSEYQRYACGKIFRLP